MGELLCSLDVKDKTISSSSPNGSEGICIFRNVGWVGVDDEAHVESNDTLVLNW